MTNDTRQQWAQRATTAQPLNCKWVSYLTSGLSPNTHNADKLTSTNNMTTGVTLLLVDGMIVYNSYIRPLHVLKHNENFIVDWCSPGSSAV